jgi:hypothetical protein
MKNIDGCGQQKQRRTTKTEKDNKDMHGWTNKDRDE